MINNKDLKVISAIIEDARIPLTSLAKKVHLPREVVQYRLKNLEKNLISGYQARINLRLFSDLIYTLFLNIPGQNREETITKLKQLPSIHWIGSTLGRWNYIISFSIKNGELNKFLDNLFNLFGNINYSLTHQLTEYKDTFAGLFGSKRLLISQKKSEKYRLDELDHRIINNLTKNARLSNSEIADRINLTREAVRMRIKNLEKFGIILGYRTMIKPQSLNLMSYVLTIKCKTPNSDALNKICNYLSLNSSVSYVCTMAGEINILAVISSKSVKELDEVCNALRNFAEIKEIEAFPLIKVGSQEYLPD
jgi:DNA-binding Lrp family transcriptional regulator